MLISDVVKRKTEYLCKNRFVTYFMYGCLQTANCNINKSQQLKVRYRITNYLGS